MIQKHFDVIIVGAGIGAGMAVHALAPAEKEILILEKKAVLPVLSAANHPLLRFQKEDFGLLRYQDGLSPAWPLSYEDLEPYYREAEALCTSRLFLPGENIQKIEAALKREGFHPFSVPAGNGPDVFSSRPNVRVLPGAQAKKIETDDSGRKIKSVHAEHLGELLEFKAPLIVLCAGAVSSAVLLLSSADSKNPNGLANSSGLVGKNLMRCNRTILPAFGLPAVSNFSPIFGLNDYYLGSRSAPLEFGRNPVPVGHIEFWASGHSGYWELNTEDLPHLDNRVEIASNNQVRLNHAPRNQAPHSELIYQFKRMLKQLGFPVCRTDIGSFPLVAAGDTGTAVFGRDPKTSVLNPWCRSHDHENLYIIDGSFFPSSSATSPMLTIAAQALRAGEYMRKAL